jgi:hypothetical protein
MTIRNHRLRTTTILLAALALIASFAGIAGPAAAAPSAPVAPDRPGAPTQSCEGDQSGTHVGAECEEDGDDGDGDDDGGSNDGGNDGGGIDAAAECGDLYPAWDDCVAVVNANGRHPGDICGYVVHPDQSQLNYYHPEAPAGDVLYYNICPREGLFYSEDTQANPGGGPPPPPDPEVVAEGLWVRVQAELLRPELRTYPPQGTASFLNLPSFVAISNWPDGGRLERGPACDDGTCVALQATPSLTWDPGDGSAVIACEPGGTRFDPDGAAQPEELVGGDACAHVYTRRTADLDDDETEDDPRPLAWPGVVSTTWNAEWQEVLDDGSTGETGSFDPVVLSTDLPRAVIEWGSVVIGYTPSGRG